MSYNGQHTDLPSLATTWDTKRLNAKAKRVMVTTADDDTRFHLFVGEQEILSQSCWARASERVHGRTDAEN